MPSERPKRYWTSPDHADGPGAGDYQHDLAPWAEPAPGNVNRRSFLKAAGFTMAAVAAGCSKAPVKHALPMLHADETLTPGRALFYASVCGGCEAGCGMLVKTLDGRPIKLEGNPENPVGRGGLCAVGQASVLGLYDSHRLREPQLDGRAVSWDELDQTVMARLDHLRRNGGRVRVLSRTITSPTVRAAVHAFLEGFDDGRHVIYDPLSCSAILDAHQQTHGARILPRYRFEHAQVIVSFDADFLGTWVDPVTFSAGYRGGRQQLDQEHPAMSCHVQFESRMSLTGSNADTRYRVAPQEVGRLLAALAARLVPGDAASAVRAQNVPAALNRELHELADRLAAARGRSLVVCGTNELEHQLLCNAINHALGNYGKTLDLTRPSLQKQGDERAVEALVHELEQGVVDALIIADANPVFELPYGPRMAQLLDKSPLTVAFTERMDETAAQCKAVCPIPHFLESWGDAEPVAGFVSVQQPAMLKLGNTRPILETLYAWMAAPATADSLIKAHWQQHMHPRAHRTESFTAFWDRVVHDGHAELPPLPPTHAGFDAAPGRATASVPADDEGFALVLYPNLAMREGRHAYNPWLQELPDPVSKVTWGNYASLSTGAAKTLGVKEGDVVRLEVSNASPGPALELPVHVQPGQHDAVVAVALGYGGESTRRFEGIGPAWFQRQPTVGDDGRVGKNAASFLTFSDGRLGYTRHNVQITRTGKRLALAATQHHHFITVPEHLAPAGGLRRPIIQETTFPAYQNDPASGAFHVHTLEKDLYPPDHVYRGHHWAMVVDLAACTGCSACVIACQAENNIPVVGKDEVRRQREMHWLRIDRYYSGQGDDVDVAYQPMMCQHCDNAPCENVCPVLATVHTEEGLNAQVYNRCVGTRYCANNCAYKARRFNWFTYRRDDQLENLVLNPDVVVRSRGVMEKCSLCVQRIQEAKIEAKRRGEPLADGAVQTACQQSCPMQAITFGDVNDPESKIAKRLASPRHFRVLEETNVHPSVGYLTLVRNRVDGAQEGSVHHG
jgi:Fe-S-cluster-containing dehydrogenase component